MMKMSSSFSLKEFLRDKVAKLDELKMATVLLEHKDALRDELSKAKIEVTSLRTAVDAMRHDLEIMKAQNTFCRNLSLSLKDLDARIVCMEENLPAEFIQEFNQLNQASPYVKSSVITGNNVNTPDNGIEDCKKTLFKNEESYTMEPLSEEEFKTIPKYMIGRHSLAVLNELVTSINAILEGKYSVLALGKAGARKKGKLDLYLSLKRDEIAVGPGEDPIYFFTAEDYRRHTQKSLDKTKLNLLTVLRHCKRLRELRAGKNLQYILVPAWERCKSGVC